jgi:hypothetical protein
MGPVRWLPIVALASRRAMHMLYKLDHKKALSAFTTSSCLSKAYLKWKYEHSSSLEEHEGPNILPGNKLDSNIKPSDRSERMFPARGGIANAKSWLTYFETFVTISEVECYKALISNNYDIRGSVDHHGQEISLRHVQQMSTIIAGTFPIVGKSIEGE